MKIQDIARTRPPAHHPPRAHVERQRAESSHDRQTMPPENNTVQQPARTSPTSYILTTAGAAALGLLAQFQTAGLLVIFVYAVATVLRRIPSHTTFTLALLALAATVVALLIGRKSIANNFVVYSFALFIVGTITLCLEQRRLSKTLREKHQKS